MKAKTIKSVLRRKIDQWCDSIADNGVAEIARKNTIVTGGSIASMLLGEKVNDYDVYLRTKEAALTIAKYYVEVFKKNPPASFKDDKKSVIPIYVDEVKDTGRIRIVVKSSGIASEDGDDQYEYFEQIPDPESTDAADYVDRAVEAVSDSDGKGRDPYRPVFLSANAITLSDDIQIVIRFYGEPDAIHENYDFVHCTNYWKSWDGQLVLRSEALEALLARELRYVGSKYPLCSVIRTRKFIKRDWSITAGQYLKMCMQISDLNLDDVEVLEDQLTGVDAAYFHQIIQLLKEKMTESKSKEIDRAYLMEVIDRIF